MYIPEQRTVELDTHKVDAAFEEVLPIAGVQVEGARRTPALGEESRGVLKDGAAAEAAVAVHSEEGSHRWLEGEQRQQRRGHGRAGGIDAEPHRRLGLLPTGQR